MNKKLNVQITSALPENKEWYKSLTIQSAIGILLILIGNTFYSGEFNTEYLVIALGCLSAIYGRFKAKSKIKE